MLGIEALKSEHTSSNGNVYPLTVEHGVYYIAPTFDQAKRIMWPKLSEVLGYEKQGGFIRRENVNDGWIELISGRRIFIKGADNPHTLRGIALSYVVLDEYADMKPFVWDEIVDPALMDVEGDALFIGTPKGKNHFYKIFMSALEGEKGYEDWEAFHFKSLDNPFLNPAEIERMMAQSNRSLDVIKQEIEASFISGGGAVLKPDWFEIVDSLPGVEQNTLKDVAGNRVATSSMVDGHIYVTVDLAGFIKAHGTKKLRSDQTVIATTLVTAEAWYVLDIQHGHWDTREVALRIMKSVSRNPGCRLGIEQGALMHAIGPYLEDEMRRFNRYVTPEALKHGGAAKIDRITGSLQGRAERGRIKLLKGDWNDEFLSEAADFPDPLSHDDLLDAVAYVDQLAVTNYFTDADYEEWEPMDLDSGY
jgi:phage terminase large subunit-like protein